MPATPEATAMEATAMEAATEAAGVGETYTMVETAAMPWAKPWSPR